ncbi:MAG: ATP-binding cassette domain-containing protein, partial [Peptostreptococcaceae bacterium]
MNTLKNHISTIFRGMSILIQMEKWYVLTQLISSIIYPLTPYVNIFMSAKIIDELLGNKDINMLIKYVILTISLNVLITLIVSGLNHLYEYHQNNFYKSENMHFSNKNMNMDYEDIEKSETTHLREQISQESMQGFNCYYLNYSINQLIQNTIQVIMSFALTYSLIVDNNIPLVAKIILLVAIIAVVYLNFNTTEKINKMNMYISDQSVAFNARFGFYCIQFIPDYNAGKDVRLYGMEDVVVDDIDNMRKGISELFRQNIKPYLKSNIMLSTLNNVMNIGIYIFMIFACVAGSISVGSIVKYVSCATLFIQGLNSAISNIQTLLNNNKYLERYIGYLDIPSKMKSGDETLDNLDKYEFEFKNVSFKYPKVKSYTLKNISFKLSEGNKIAVVGMSGSGKTTMIKLLCRLYDPTEGEITLNGVNIKDYDYEEYLK